MGGKGREAYLQAAAGTCLRQTFLGVGGQVFPLSESYCFQASKLQQIPVSTVSEGIFQTDDPCLLDCKSGASFLISCGTSLSPSEAFEI